MTSHLFSRIRVRRITAAAMVLALVSSLLLFNAGAASAHHPELLSATAGCAPNGYTVDFVSRSWAPDAQAEGEFVDGGLNADIDVAIDLPDDGRGSFDLLDPEVSGAITRNESAITPGNGHYVDPGRTFDGTFTVPVGYRSVTITVTAVAAWGNGVHPGATRSLTLELPAPGKCARPKVTSTFRCVGGLGAGTVELANNSSDSTQFVVTLSGPQGYFETDTVVVDSSNSPQVVFYGDLPNGDYVLTARANGAPIHIGGNDGYITLACSAAVGDRSWQDWNRNGIQNVGEPDQPLALIALSTGATDTDGDGQYLFGGLDPDQNYTVTFDSATGLVRAPANVGNDDTVDSDADESGVAPVPDLAPGETDLSIDAGYWLDSPPPVCTTGDVVWANNIDLSPVNQIGIPDSDVRLVAGRTTSFTLPGPLPVEFEGPLDITSIEAVSWDGYWSRPSTAPQPNERWRVVFSLDGVPVGASGYTDDVADLVYTAGWSGLLDIGDGIALPNGADAVVLEHWSVAQNSTRPDSIVPVAVCITTAPRPASLGDRVWFDADADGIQGAGEAGIPGVTVNLLTSEGVPLATTETDASGSYEFSGLDPQMDYIVEFVRLGGVFTVPNVGDDPAVDSDANPANGRSGVVELDSGEHDPTIDAGVIGLTPSIDIEKSTNGVDADEPSGPVLAVGSTVTWAYVVTNTGAYDLVDVTVTDDKGVTPELLELSDVGGDGVLSVGESWTYVATGVAAPGPYANVGDVVGSPVVDGEPARDPFGKLVPDVTDEDPSHYVGFVPGDAAVDIEKSTNGFDADSPDPGVNQIPEIEEGETVTWVYVVTNTSDSIWLADIDVTDDVVGAICTIDGPLAPLASDECTATGVAELGAYANVATVSASPVNSDGTPAKNPDGSAINVPSAQDPSHYVGVPAEILPEIGPPLPPLVRPVVPPLAVTGTESKDLALGALLLIAVGSVLAAFGRRRRRIGS